MRILLLLLLTVLAASAEIVKLKFDPRVNPEPDYAGTIVYTRTDPNAEWVEAKRLPPFPEGVTPNFELDLDLSVVNYVMVRAYNTTGLESIDSNVVAASDLIPAGQTGLKVVVTVEVQVPNP